MNKIKQITIIISIIFSCLFGEDPLLEGIEYYNNRSSKTIFNNNDGKTYAASENIDKAIQYFLSANPNENLEVALYLLKSYYFKGEYVLKNEKSKKAVFDKGKQLGEKYIKRYPQSASIRYWYLVNLGSWAEVYGTLKAAREGVADIMKEQSEIIIKLDSQYKDGGGYFMLGAVHLKSPYIPFLLSWPDKNQAVDYLSRATYTGKSTLVQKRHLAHASYKTGDKKYAIGLLEEIIRSKPSKDEYLEDLEDIREAKLLLKSFN